MLAVIVLIPIFLLIGYSTFLMGKVVNSSAVELEKVKKELTQAKTQAQAHAKQVQLSQAALKEQSAALLKAKRETEEIRGESGRLRSELRDKSEQMKSREEQIKSLYEQLKEVRKVNDQRSEGRQNVSPDERPTAGNEPSDKKIYAESESEAVKPDSERAEDNPDKRPEKTG